MYHQRGVAAIVDDQRGTAAIGPFQRLARAPPVLLQRFALPREHRRALGIVRRAAGLETANHDCRGRMILRRKDVAGHPAHIRAELGERFDQHGGLNRHVQAAHDARAGERLPNAVLFSERHQPGHLLLGEANFLAPEIGERKISDFVGRPAGGFGGGEWMKLFSYSGHRLCSLF